MWDFTVPYSSTQSPGGCGFRVKLCDAWNGFAGCQLKVFGGVMPFLARNEAIWSNFGVSEDQNQVSSELWTGFWGLQLKGYHFGVSKWGGLC